MPAVGERFARLEDTLRLAHQMFADNPSPFHGATLSADCPINHPLPLSTPRPPIMVAGGGEQRTLRLVAQYADACNVFLAGPGSLEERAAVVAHKFEVLRGHCRDVGRAYDDIKRTALVTFTLGGGMTVPEVLDTCRAAADAGVQELIVMLDEPHDLQHLETLGTEVIPTVATW